jgi:hypothetical protein
MCLNQDAIVPIDLIVNSATTLAAAFAGAWAAFQLENRRRKREAVERHLSAVNRALYTVFNLWNILFQFQKEVIDPVRGKPDVWLNMSATLPSSYGLTSFQADELAFLLQTPHANTYSELLLEEQRFWVAIHQIELRSSIVLNQIFPRFSAAGVPVGAALTEPQIEGIIGIDVVHKLKQLTAGIIENVDENVKSLRTVHDALRNAITSVYPNKKVIRIGFEETKVDARKDT